MQHKCSKLLLLGIILALLFSISPSLLAQESTAEPPTPEPPTAEPPTLEPSTPEPPTAEPPTLPPPTLEPPTLEPPTAAYTELPTLTATYTDTVVPTLIFPDIEVTPEVDLDSLLDEETYTPTPTPTFTASPTAAFTPSFTPTCQAGTLWDAWWGYPNPLPEPSTIPGNFQIVQGSFQSTYINNDVPRGVWGQGNSTTHSELEVLWTFPAVGWVTSVELQLLKSRNGGSELSAGYTVYLDNVQVGSGQPARAGLDNWIINLDVPDSWYSSMRVEIHQTRTQPYARTFFARARLRSTCTSTITFTPSHMFTLTPTPTNTPSATPMPQTYKIQFATDGVRNWSAAELTAIDMGVNQVGVVLQAISLQGGSPQEVFNRVMVDGGVTDFILFVRGDSSTSTIGGISPDITITYSYNSQNYTVTYDDIDNGNCKAFDSGMIGSVPRPRAVVCNGALNNGTGIASEYTIVHELGHIFDYRSGNALTNAISPGTFSLGSCSTTEFSGSNYIVMGELPGLGFQRGSRGWGSGPGFSTFQQSSENTPLEAAADMFLNWVYRHNSPNGTPIVSGVQTNAQPPQNGCVPVPNQTTPFPQNWNGFLNQNWNGSTNPFDWGLPGDVRHSYMIGLITNIFQNHPTW